MNPSTPPLLPGSFEPAWKSYVPAVISLIPAFAAWFFGSIFLQARLEMLWEKAGLEGTRPQWLMALSDGIRFNFWIIVSGVIVPLVALELGVRSWPRYRRAVIFSAGVILNALVLFWTFTIATCALLASPLLAQPK